MNQTQSIERANRAKAILDNPMWAEAFEMCRQSLFSGIEKCELNDTATAENLRKSLRLLLLLRANLEMAVNHGKVDLWKLNEEAKAKANPFRGLFR